MFTVDDHRYILSVNELIENAVRSIPGITESAMTIFFSLVKLSSRLMGLKNGISRAGRGDAHL